MMYTLTFMMKNYGIFKFSTLKKKNASDLASASMSFKALSIHF